MIKLSNTELKKAQKIMIIILQEIDKICTENNIKYWLDSGSLIGAVRHKGFIPWDDDLDIGMLREDYNRFLKLAEDKLNSCFFLQSEFNEREYANPFAKIMIKNTLWVESMTQKAIKRNCIFVDIFPYDKIPQNIILQKIAVAKHYILNNAILMKCNYPCDKSKTIKSRFFVFLGHLYSFIFSLDKLKKKRLKLHTKYNNLKQKFYITKYGGNFYKNQNPISSYEDIILCKFENFLFPIPKEYDSILTNLYGDYLKLPPENERFNHGIIEYDFGCY